MTEIYDAPISLKMVKKILEERYLEKYKHYENVSVKIEPVMRTHTYTDWGFTSSDTYYVFKAKISFVKKVGILSMNGSFSKDFEELKNDLMDELKEMCEDDEYIISSVTFPDFENSSVNWDAEVKVNFDKKNNYELVKKYEGVL